MYLEHIATRYLPDSGDNYHVTCPLFLDEEGLTTTIQVQLLEMFGGTTSPFEPLPRLMGKRNTPDSEEILHDKYRLYFIDNDCEAVIRELDRETGATPDLGSTSRPIGHINKRERTIRSNREEFAVAREAYRVAIRYLLNKVETFPMPPLG